MRILVVEDHHILRETLAHVLSLEGYQVMTADSTEEIVELPLTEKWDMAILDINLPGQSGLVLADRLRCRQPNIGIVMVSARHTQQDKLQGYQQGADLYFTKPIDPQELIAAINAFCRRLSSQSHAKSSCSFVLNMRARTLTSPSGQECRLTIGETDILYRILMTEHQQIEIWQLRSALGTLDDETNKLYEVKLSRLRKKLMQLGATAESLVAIRGVGYQLNIAVQIV